MDLPRVIPALLVKGEAFVKTTRFTAPAYVGDPLNTIDLFNQFEVDEIVVLDIDATAQDRGPNFGLMEALAAKCWVPLAVGGGIRDLETARRLFAAGIEKVVLGSVLADQPEVAGEIAAIAGRQAVVASVDVRRSQAGRYEVVCSNGTRPVSDDPAAWSRRATAAGAGEILLQSVDRDGTRQGFDLELIALVSSAVDVPVVALGGAGRRAELPGPVDAGAAAVAAGSLFVFQGSAGGVLVNFPSRAQLVSLFGPSARAAERH